MKKHMAILRAIADPTRFTILKILQDGVYCVCEITEALGLAQPTVSRHLRILEEAGLVTSRREGQRVDYRLAKQEAGSPGEEILSFVTGRLEDDPGIVGFRERCRSIQQKSGRTP